MNLLALRKFSTNTSRILVGVLFILSGLIKANDPTGFGYKLDEYWEVFHTTFLSGLSVYMAMFICIIEIFLGVSLLMGTYKKLTLTLLIAMMVFFTFLTFYSAYFNKVQECGCFGDAIRLTPWQSFGKDVVLCVLIAILWLNRNLIEPLWLEDQKGELVAMGSIIVSLVFTLYCWYYLPVKDFLPYAVGKDILQQMTIPPNAPKAKYAMKFVYTKDGRQCFVSENGLDSFCKLKDFGAYKYDTTISEQLVKGYEPPIHDFVIYDKGGVQNITQNFLHQEGYRLMIVQYDLGKSNTSSQKDVNKLVDGLENTPVKIWPLTSSNEDIIEKYSKDNGVKYKFFTSDNTTLKTMIRSNPGLILYDGNLVIAKWPGTMCPSAKEVLGYVKKEK